MKKFIFILLVLPIMVFSQSNNTQNDINRSGFQINLNPAVSYFGNSVKTHWEIEAGWISPKSGNGVTIGLEGMFDSKTFDTSVSSYDQQSAFINLVFHNKLGVLSYGWLVKDDADIFHESGNVDCFRVKISSYLSTRMCVFGAYYFDKDDGTGERHDLPSIGFSYVFGR